MEKLYEMMTMNKKERTLQEILRAAKAIVHADGHESVTVRHLAAQTGLAYTSLYYYFKDLNALLWTLRLEMIEDMVSELTAVDLVHKNPVEELLARLSQYSAYFSSTRMFSGFSIFASLFSQRGMTAIRGCKHRWVRSGSGLLPD